MVTDSSSLLRLMENKHINLASEAIITLLGRIGILAYVISSLVELANYQSNVKNLMW